MMCAYWVILMIGEAIRVGPEPTDASIPKVSCRACRMMSPLSMDAVNKPIEQADWIAGTWPKR